MMFAGLPDVDWTALEHAYGSAEDVPCPGGECAGSGACRGVRVVVGRTMTRKCGAAAFAGDAERAIALLEGRLDVEADAECRSV